VIKKPLIIPFLITLIFSTFAPITIHSANAATVGTSPCIATVSSTTGVTATTSGNYCVVSFTDTTTAVTWTVPTGVSSVRTLVVGGGGGTGGGGCNWMYTRGGGGGAVVDTAETAVIAGTALTIIVGAGGVAPVERGCGGPAGLVSNTGTQGGSSKFGSNSAVSGGGSSPLTTSAGGTSGSGYAGSGANQLATTMSSFAGGGGGGAGGAGTQESDGANTWVFADKAGKGGIGIFSDITGVSIGHGGGGAGYASSGPGTATSGGGTSTLRVNSGGSYGGGGHDGYGGYSGRGGDGIVIVKYLKITITIPQISHKLKERGSFTMDTATVSSGSATYGYSGTSNCTGTTSGRTITVSFSTSGTCIITATASSSPYPTASTTFQIVPNITQKLISRTGIQPNALSSFIPPPYLSTSETYTVTSCVSIVGATGADLLSSTNLSFSLASLLVSPGVITDTGAGKSYTITGTLAQVQAAFSIFKLTSTSGRIMAANSGSIYLRARTNLVVDSDTDTGCQDFNDARITLYQYTSDQVRRKNVPQRSGSTP
jgi:hypothetical protein